MREGKMWERQRCKCGKYRSDKLHRWKMRDRCNRLTCGRTARSCRRWVDWLSSRRRQTHQHISRHELIRLRRLSVAFHDRRLRLLPLRSSANNELKKMHSYSKLTSIERTWVNYDIWILQRGVWSPFPTFLIWYWPFPLALSTRQNRHHHLTLLHSCQTELGCKHFWFRTCELMLILMKHLAEGRHKHKRFKQPYERKYV